MSQIVVESGNAVNLTATGNVILGTNCLMLGFYVNSTTAGTVVFRKGGSGGTVLNGVITPVMGFHRFPATCQGGLHATIGGALDITVFVVEGSA